MSPNAAGPESEWTPARLIPTAGIRGQEEQETRATSALLAVLPAVPDFGHELLGHLRAPKGRIATYTEVRLKDEEGTVHIPDGAIVVERGKRRWSCLVEVKTARSQLGAEQVLRYLEMARVHGFDGLLTISNQIRATSDSLPYEVDKRKVGKLTVRHLSWWGILTEAIMQHRFRGVEDPDQAFILNELIRYLDDERSGASGFEGMGEEWSGVRDSARDSTLQARDPQAALIAGRWEQLVEYLALQLSQELGVTVRQSRPRRKSSGDRIADATRDLAESGVLVGSLEVPNAVGAVGIEADLRSSRVTTTVEIAAPADRRAKARVSWLLRQLRDVPPTLRIETRFAKTGRTTTASLEDAREIPASLLLADDPKREPRSFCLAVSRPMGRKRGRTEGSFVTETRRQMVDFYRDLVQDLTPPPAKAPRLPEEDQAHPDPPQEPEPSESTVRRAHDAGFRQLAELAQNDLLA